MQFSSIRYYIWALIKDGHYFQNVNAELKYIKPALYFNSLQWIIILCSLGFVFISHTGISQDFSKYLMAVFGILIGMYSTLIWSVFGKYKDLKIEEINTVKIGTAVEKVKLKEFFKQFNAISNYLRLMCFLLIILLSLSSFVNTNKQIILSHFTVSYIRENIAKFSFYKDVTILIYRGVTFYFIFNFFMLSLFIFGGSYRYMKFEYDKKISAG